MPEERPKVDFTMTWDCTFVIDGKAEEITLMTDDIEDVFAEYQRLKKQYKSVVWMKHELHRKGKLIISGEMMGLPIPEVTIAPPVHIADDAGRPPGWMDQHNRDLARGMLNR